jgi:hypothetical protein
MKKRGRENDIEHFVFRRQLFFSYLLLKTIIGMNDSKMVLASHFEKTYCHFLNRYQLNLQNVICLNYR